MQLSYVAAVLTKRIRPSKKYLKLTQMNWLTFLGEISFISLYFPLLMKLIYVKIKGLKLIPNNL